MHHTLTQALYEMFPRDEKGDFHHAYLYLKHLNHFMYHALTVAGSNPKKPEGELGEDIDDLLAAMIQGVAETAASRDTSTYHGKVVLLKDALQLVTQKRDISLEPPETVIPYKQARSLILQNPESISVGECACRAAAEDSCLPEGQRDVCLFVGDPHASFIGEFNEKFHKISQDDAVANCCACCCQGMKAWNLFEGAIPVLAPSGYLSEISDECNDCGLCVDACGFDAIKLDEDTQSHCVDKDKCMGCAVCEDICPVEAISLRREPSKGEPLDLAELLAAAPA
jgi:Pyruvate/2-oxoacid:ferredoxin oxidoreductase delta subunit